MPAAHRCQTHLGTCLSKTQLSRTDPWHGDVFAGVGGQEVQFRADTEVAELGTKAVPAGWCLGWGSSPKAVPSAPGRSLGSTARGSGSLGSPGCRNPAPAPGKRQSQTVNHGAPVISRSRRAIPTSSWALPTEVPITGWEVSRNAHPGPAPPVPADLSPSSGEIYGLRWGARNVL